jgi:hypothetical protein
MFKWSDGSDQTHVIAGRPQLAVARFWFGHGFSASRSKKLWLMLLRLRADLFAKD